VALKKPGQHICICCNSSNICCWKLRWRFSLKKSWKILHFFHPLWCFLLKSYIFTWWNPQFARKFIPGNLARSQAFSNALKVTTWAKLKRATTFPEAFGNDRNTCGIFFHMGVAINGGVPPKLMVYNGQSDEHGWELGGNPILGNLHRDLLNTQFSGKGWKLQWYQ